MPWVKKNSTWLALAACTAVGLVAFFVFRQRPQQTLAAEAAPLSTSSRLRVETIAPAPLGMARVSVVPGSAHSFESADVFAKVSGYLKLQKVDIGSRVAKGDPLAEIDVPELQQELIREKALLRQAEAEVGRAEAGVKSVKAEHQASIAQIAQAESNVKRFESERELRDKQYERIRELFSLNSIEERLVEEKLDQLNAARAAETAAHNSVITAQQQALAAAARIADAEAELEVAKAKVDVARAVHDKTAALVSFAHITSPYDGVVTARKFHPGAFIRAAHEGAEVPLFSIDRIDLMRVVVQVPDRDVPYVHNHDKAVVVFDALPGERFEAKVSRLSASEDPESRTMRVEIDLNNPDEEIRDGMYGQVEIELEPAAAGITIPSGCLVGSAGPSGAKVYVVADGLAKLTSIQIGKDTGTNVEVVSGLSTQDRVVAKPPSALNDGMAVEAVSMPTAKPAAH